MRAAILYQSLSQGDSLQCNVCLWRCRIAPGHLGRCRVRLHRDGKLHSLAYGIAAAAHVDPVEKKPLFHFFPGSKVFSLGSLGCNFRCKHCQNWSISYAEAETIDNGIVKWQVQGYPAAGFYISPEQAIAAAITQGCQGICWTYNEPAMWFEYTLDCARLAHQHNLYTAYVTNGYLTPEAVDEIGPFLDAFRVDVKGFGDALYRNLAKVPKWQGLLETARRAKERWQMHVEVVTNIVPTFNDDDGQLRQIAEWIAEHLGVKTPWHVTAFHPDAALRGVPATPLSSLQRARDIGSEVGLKFVYLGNVSEGQHTRCPNCGAVVVEREGYRTRVLGLDRGGRCAGCGEDLEMRVSGTAPV